MQVDTRYFPINNSSDLPIPSAEYEMKYLLFGIFMGALGYIVGGWQTLLIVVLFLFLFFLLHKPTFGLFFLPFFVLLDFAVKGSGATGILGLWDEILFCVLLVVLLYYLNRQKIKILHYSLVFFPIVVFLVIGLLSILFSNTVTIHQGIEAIRSVIQSFVFFFLVMNTPLSKKEIRSLLFLVVLGGVICASYGIYQYIVGVSTPPTWVDKDLELGLLRAFSFLGSPNAFSAYCIMIAPIALGFAYRSSYRLSHKILFWSLFLLLIGGLISSLTRASWLALIPALCLFMLLIKKGKYILLVLLAVAITIIFIPPIQQRFSTLFSDQYQAKSASGGRTYRWSLALDLARQKPLLGQGPGSYGGAVAYRYQEYNGLYSDNYYLEILSNYGFLGLITFLAIFLFLFKLLFATLHKVSPEDRTLIAGVISGAVALLINMYTENLWEIIPLSVIFWFFTALALKLGMKSDSE